MATVRENQQEDLWNEAAMIAGFILDMADGDKKSALALFEKINFPTQPPEQQNRAAYIREHIEEFSG